MSDLHIEMNWGRQKKCDACKIKVTDRISDAKIPAYGAWGFVCDSCFQHFRCQHGTGKGQLFERQPNSDLWRKIKG